MTDTEHLDTIKRFLHSQERLMLIIGDPGSGNSHPLDNLVGQLRLSRHIIRVKGNAQLQPSQIVELFSKNWIVKFSRTKTRLELQLLDIISSLTQHDQNCLLVIDDAHTLSYAVLAALSFLNNAQEGQKVYLHLLLSGQSSLLEKTARMQIKQIPKITLSHAHAAHHKKLSALV